MLVTDGSRRLAHDGEAFLAEFNRCADDLSLVTLDVMLPDTDGFALCKIVRRRSNVPIIMLTASSDETDRVLWRQLGADDYIAKPYSPRELLARIKAIHRRAGIENVSSPRFYRFVGFTLDTVARTVLDAAGQIVPLTGLDFQLLRYFVEDPGDILDRNVLCEETRGRDAGPLDRSLDVQISRLRLRLNDGGKQPLSIKTVRVAGYVFSADVSVSHARIAIDQIALTMKQDLPHVSNTRIAFAWPDNLKVSENGSNLGDLPDHWGQAILMITPRPAPILVIQVEMEPGHWLYLASLMPNPYFLETSNPMSLDRLLRQGFSLAAVLLLSILVARWITRSLAALPKAAEAFGNGERMPALPDRGSREFVNTARAFGAMRERIQRYLEDRERLFVSISHDLRAPITRLKLRAELLDDDALRSEFHDDLDELEGGMGWGWASRAVSCKRMTVDFCWQIILAADSRPR